MRGGFRRALTPANPFHGRIVVGTYAYHAGGTDYQNAHRILPFAGRVSLKGGMWQASARHCLHQQTGKQQQSGIPVGTEKV